MMMGQIKMSGIQCECVSKINASTLASYQLVTSNLEVLQK